MVSSTFRVNRRKLDVPELTVKFIPNDISRAGCNSNHTYRYVVLGSTATCGGFRKANELRSRMLVRIINGIDLINISANICHHTEKWMLHIALRRGRVQMS